MYCHPSDYAFKAALSNGSMLGVALVPADVDLARSVLGPCPQCLAGKSVNPSYVSSPTMPAGRCGTRVFMDLVPLAGTTIGGNNHVLLWLDAYSGYLGVCGVDNKKPQSILKALELIVSQFDCNGHTIEEVVTDSEAVFAAVSPHLSSLLEAKHQLTPPKQHNQRIERYVRTINDRMRSVLATLDFVLPNKLYGELMSTVVTFMNHFPNKVHPTLTPAIVFKGTKLDCREFNNAPFGTAAMIMETDQSGVVSKYSPRAELGLILGPSMLVRSAVHVYVQSTKMIKTRNRYTIVPMVPSDFGFESKTGTVLSSIPDFLYYDPSLRSVESEFEYDPQVIRPHNPHVYYKDGRRHSKQQTDQEEALDRSLEMLQLHTTSPNVNPWSEQLRMKSLRYREDRIREAQPSVKPGFPSHLRNPVSRTSLRGHQGDNPYPSLHLQGTRSAQLFSEQIHDLSTSMTSNHDHVGDIDASSTDTEVILPIMSAKAPGTRYDAPATGPLDEVLTSEGVELESQYNDNNQDLYTDRSAVSSELLLSHKFQKGRRKTKPDDTRPQGEQAVLRPSHQGDTRYPNAAESSQHRQVIPLKRKVSTETSARAPESS
jgi:hypothetical protein